MIANLSIGQVAVEASVNVETIRYYQRRGLVDEPARPTNGHRRYSAVSVKRVRFIKRAQALGFTLDEIAGLIDLDASSACGATRELAARKLQLIDNKLADLGVMRKALATLMRRCDTTIARACPIIDALGADP